MKKFSLYVVTRSAVISALYFCITMLTAPISFGPIQIRIGESMTLLPVLFPEASIGLAIGCALANISSPFGILDVIVGSTVTLVAGLLSSKCKNVYLAGLPPVLLNAIILPMVWIYLGVEEFYLLNVLYLTVSQGIVVYLIGIPIVKAIERVPALNRRN
jgi:uncharacterized membrane protein